MQSLCLSESLGTDDSSNVTQINENWMMGHPVGAWAWFEMFLQLIRSVLSFVSDSGRVKEPQTNASQCMFISNFQYMNDEFIWFGNLWLDPWGKKQPLRLSAQISKWFPHHEHLPRFSTFGQLQQLLGRWGHGKESVGKYEKKAWTHHVIDNQSHGSCTLMDSWTSNCGRILLWYVICVDII